MRQVVAFIYAQLHSLSYRNRYDGLLRTSCPHVFAADNPLLFGALSLLGEEFFGLHLLESVPPLRDMAVPTGTTRAVEKVSYSDALFG